MVGSTRGVLRIVDTVLLVCNVLEWGADSVRGRFCIDRINAIHARFRIPNEAFKYVLLGIAFIPFEFNQRFGWRKMTETERLGWFHAFVRLGRHMNIDEIHDDFDGMYAWYRRVSDHAARFAPNKQRLVYDILGQVLACYPANVRGVLVAAFVAGMDDTYLTASALPRVPEAMEAALRRLFAMAGQRARATALQGPWLQSLLTSSVYPEGYELDQLGVSPRASRVLPGEGTMTLEQVEQRVVQGEFLVVFDGGVRNRLYNVFASERLVLPEIPCSYDSDMSRKDYLKCVTASLIELLEIHGGPLTFLQALRLELSAIRAYDESH